jgi:hypothetical protein
VAKTVLKRLSADIDPKLHRWLKTKAAREDRAVRDLVEEALRALRGKNGTSQ